MVVIENDVLLTGSTVRQWEMEGEEIDRKITELLRRRDEITRKLDAVKLLIGDAKPAPVNVVMAAVGNRLDESMTDAVLRVIKEAGKPLEHHQIKERLYEVPRLRESIQKNVNYYYTVIGRLIERKAIEKIGKTYALSQTNEAPTEQSESASKPEGQEPAKFSDLL